MSEINEKLHAIYYSPRGYWRGHVAIGKLAIAAKVARKIAKSWLEKQAIYQIYMPGPKRINRPIFDEDKPNAVHQSDILYLPYDKVNKKTYKYALTIIDIASRFKAAEPLTDKTAGQVAEALTRIYTRGPLKWPHLLMVDSGKEFFGYTTKVLKEHNVQIRRGIPAVHRQQAIVERYNRTLAERLFGHQYYKELQSPEKRSTEWVRRLPEVVAALNNEVTRLINMKPATAIKKDTVKYAIETVHKPEKLLNSDVLLRYLYAPGELEGGTTRRATDPIWSLTVHRISNILQKPGQPALYYLEDGPKRSFVHQELQVLPWTDSMITLMEDDM